MEKANRESNCKHLTHEPMNFNAPSLLIVILSFALIILPALAGCDEEDRTIYYGTDTTTQQTHQTTSQTQGEGGSSQTRADVKNVRYELAEGWHWDNSTKTIAIKGPEYEIEARFDGKMEFGGVWEGGEESAKAHAKAIYEAYKQGCANSAEYCLSIPEYGEIDVSGTLLYCAYDANGMGNSWSSYCEFGKNGKAVRFMLYNRAEKEMPLLEKMVTTIMWD